MNTPLNDKAQVLAEQEAALIKRYIGKRRLPQGDFYGMAAEGFLQAAQAYTDKPELQNICPFSSVAMSRMRGKIGAHFAKERRRREIAPMVRLHESELAQDCPQLRAVESRETYAELCESIAQVLTPRQSALIRQLADGISEKELGRRHGITTAEVRRELASARAALAPHKEELYAIAA